MGKGYLFLQSTGTLYVDNTDQQTVVVSDRTMQEGSICYCYEFIHYFKSHNFPTVIDIFIYLPLVCKN